MRKPPAATDGFAGKGLCVRRIGFELHKDSVNEIKGVFDHVAQILASASISR